MACQTPPLVDPPPPPFNAMVSASPASPLSPSPLAAPPLSQVLLHDLPAPANVLVSELFGTLLLGESALHYISDARARLLGRDHMVVPRMGVQMATLLECSALELLTKSNPCSGWPPGRHRG